MSKYLIHATPKRLWYVNEYLIPSMIKQGIKEENIQVFNDDKGLGNLKACMKSFDELPEKGSTWHLQDDVLISPDFKEVTEIGFNDRTIVCGFASDLYDGKALGGVVTKQDMWYSFQCIRIPNRFAKGCADWVDKYMIGNMIYQEYWGDGLNDDWFFRKYIEQTDEELSILNLIPNIVEHIDFLIGGSTILDEPRKSSLRSRYWNYPELTRELMHSLNAKE